MGTASRFVWHDFNTRDIDGAKRFYGELFGWVLGKSDNGPYHHIKAGEQMIGGMRVMDAHEPGPPCWISYAGVDDVDAAVASAKEHGGKVIVPAMSIPNVGTFAIVADPTGAMLSPWKSAHPEQDREPTGRPAMHTFCWDELLTPDAAKAAPFYERLFGWTVEAMDMGPMGTYRLLKRPGVKDEKGMDKNAGGIMQSPPDAPHPPFWLAYVAVPDADATTEKAKHLGGSVIVPPTDIPNVGRFAILMDDQKAAIAILQPAM